MEFRCGLVGLGRIGCGFDDDSNKKSINTHAGAYFSNKKARLVALCDIDKKKLSKYGTKYNVLGLYTDYKKMFKNEQLDCVSICTLADSHLQIVEEAAKHKVKGIFLEKPISDTLENASSIIKLCRTNKIKLQIDFQRRFDPFYRSVKEIIQRKKFGRIQHGTIYYGAGITNTGSHIFDLIRFFFDEIRWVKGNYSKNSSNNLSDPNIDGVIGCENGINCNVHSLDVSNYGVLEFDIFGTNARIRLNLTKSTAEYFEISHSMGLAYGELVPKPFTISNRKDAIVIGLENLFHSIETDKEPICRGEDGYSSLEVVIAMIESAKKGIQINLPLKTSTYKISSK